ncbi:MAG: Kef family K(+) transporter [Deltaproteobacteria bacterium]|nr:Kef family K(+) transporter [Deltaproteobacteria bacterium]
MLAAVQHETPLIATIVVGLGFAFVLGIAAARLKLSPIVGFLLAGIAVGPHTPGFVGDAKLAAELAEIGVILLMFGVGLHFSLADLLAVRRIAVPGAVVQIAVATLLGILPALALGWSLGAGLVLGLALSVASTVVLLRALEERRLLVSERGRIALGWLIVEDLAMVVALVLIPAFAAPPGQAAPDQSWAVTLFTTLLQLGGFVAAMLIVGRRAVPWVLSRVARLGSRELFTLAVLAIALGIAFISAKLFGVSFALGAFFAGMVLNGSELSHDAAERSLPFRDAFAVLFFVSVGMLFDPSILVREPLAVIGVCLVILIGKSIAAWAIVRAFGYPTGTALTIAAALAQVGEFSFIVIGLGISLGLIPQGGHDLVIAGAIVSITLNPLMFNALGRLQPKLDRLEHLLRRRRRRGQDLPTLESADTSPEGHIVVIGHGGVGARVASELVAKGHAVTIVDADPAVVDALTESGQRVIYGHASGEGVLDNAHVERASLVIVTIPNAFEAAVVCQRARARSPRVPILARAQSEVEVAHLRANGATDVIVGEHELARALAHRAESPIST